jgi:hypothetical protein
MWRRRRGRRILNSLTLYVQRHSWRLLWIVLYVEFLFCCTSWIKNMSFCILEIGRFNYTIQFAIQKIRFYFLICHSIVVIRQIQFYRLWFVSNPIKCLKRLRKTKKSISWNKIISWTVFQSRNLCRHFHLGKFSPTSNHERSRTRESSHFFILKSSLSFPSQNVRSLVDNRTNPAQKRNAQVERITAADGLARVLRY